MNARLFVLSSAMLVVVASGRAYGQTCHDPASVVAQADQPFVDHSDVEPTLTCWRDAFMEAGDRRAIFAVVYTEIVERILQRARDGFFEDREWIERYVTALAEQYRKAMVEYETAGSLAGPWGKAFAGSEDGTLSVVQELLLGINAHYNYDLAIAIHTAGVSENISARHRDHLALNTILEAAIDEVQDDIVRDFAPGLGSLDERFGDADEVIVAALIHGALDFAWLNALRMNDLLASWVRFELWTYSNGIADLLLLPTYYEPVMEKIRKLEQL